MPITRTPIVDDSGGGTDGTVIDNAWKQELYNQIDAFALMAPWTEVEATLAAADHIDFNPGTGIVGNTILYLQVSTSVTTIYGFKPAAPAFRGQRIIVHTISDPARTVNFYHEHGSPSPGCFLRCRKSPIVTVNGFWTWAEFQYGVQAGVGGWVMGGFGNGIGGA